MKISANAALIGGAALAAAAGLWWLSRNGGAGARAVAGGAVSLAGGAAVGVVKGIGDAVGLPDPADARTLAEGYAAFYAGRYLEASAKLPAGEFFRLLTAPSVVKDNYVGDLPIADSTADGVRLGYTAWPTGRFF